MKFEYDQIKSIFGSEDKNIGQLVMFLAINYPNITPTDIFNIFKTTVEHYSTESDCIEDQTLWINRQYSGRTVADIQENPADIKQNYHSTFVFRNFYKVIDQSKEWQEALKSNVLLKKMIVLKDQIIKQLKQDYRNTILLDKFEIVCEFIDLVSKKWNELNGCN